MQGAMGFLVTIWLQIYQREKIKSVKIWQKYGHESVAPLFWPTCRSKLYLNYPAKKQAVTVKLNSRPI